MCSVNGVLIAALIFSFAGLAVGLIALTLSISRATSSGDKGYVPYASFPTEGHPPVHLWSTSTTYRPRPRPGKDDRDDS